MTPAERALVELSRASARVKALTSQISDARTASRETQEADGGIATDWLEKAYEHCYEGEGPYSDTAFMHTNHEGDVAGYLAEHCPHALRAHELIQERKAARKALGVAKRRVTALGNKLAAQDRPITAAEWRQANEEVTA